MNKLDEQIRDALEAADSDFEDEDIFDYEGMMKLFRGHGRWLTIIFVSFMVVTITMMVVSAVQFFQVESVRAMIAWATGFTVCFVLEAFIEFWFLAECRKNTLQCQMKRLELQVAVLVGRLPKEEQ